MCILCCQQYAIEMHGKAEMAYTTHGNLQRTGANVSLGIHLRVTFLPRWTYTVVSNSTR